jgi:plastocyanin
MRRVALLAVIVCAAAAVPAFAAGQSAVTAGTKTVKVGDNYYRARSVRIRRGSKVIWRWGGHRRHDVYFTSAPRGAKPRRCKAQRHGKCSRSFRKRGTYEYVCTLHGNMAGRVRVR